MPQSTQARLSAIPIALLLAELLALVAGSIIAYPHVPSRIPEHYGINGAPDRWVATTWGTWLLPVVIAMVVCGFIVGVAAVIPRDLRLLNLPDKKRLMQLPRHRQAVVVVIARNAIHWLAVCIAAVFIVIQIENFVVARGGGQTRPELTVLPFVLVAIVLFIVVRLHLRLKHFDA
jgi:uncharacterized membrane protein